MGATQEMVDAYFMANGMSPVTGYAADGVTPIINEASGYKEDGTSSSDYKSADGTLYAPAGTRNMYVNREPRFYADITFSNSKWFSGTEGDYTVDFTYSGNCGKAQGNNDFTSTGYLVRKNMDSGDRNQNLVCVLLRLTNIYFDYIEALAYVDPSHADIWKYMNLIRERAGINETSSDPELKGKVYGLNPNMNQSEMREAVREERFIELLFEQKRMWDLRRWMIYDKLMIGQEKRHALVMNKQTDGTYTTYLFDRDNTPMIAKQNMYFLPIKRSELSNNPNLEQTKGWENGTFDPQAGL